MATSSKTKAAPRESLTYYDYHDDDGNVLFRVARSPEKAFWQEVPDGTTGKWTKGLGDTRRVLYRLPEIIAAETKRVVVVTEGERDVDSLRALGFLATTNPMGALKWTAENDAELGYGCYLAGCDVVVMGDFDEFSRQLGYVPGWRHIDNVAQALQQWAKRIRLVYGLPGTPPPKDVTDWIKAGGTREQLQETIKATPDWDGTLRSDLQCRCARKVFEQVAYLSPEQWLAQSRKLLDKFEELTRK